MGFRGFEDAEIVDGPVGAPSRVGPRPGVVTVSKNADGSFVTVDSTGSGATGGQGPGQGQSALVPLDALQKARAVSLFVTVPFLAAVAMSSKVPGWVRWGAGLLAAWEAAQIATSTKEIAAMLPQQGP